MGWLRNKELSDTERQELEALARSPKRRNADRARAILLTYQKQTAEQIGLALGVKAQSVRVWRIRFTREGVEGLKEKAHTGRKPRKREAALSVVPQLLESPEQSLTCPRLVEHIQTRTGVTLSPGYLSKILKKGAGLTGDLATVSRTSRTSKKSLE